MIWPRGGWFFKLNYEAASSATIKENVSIGDWTFLQPGCYIGAGTEIGRYCSIGRGVEISPMEHPLHFVSTHEFVFHRRRFKHHPRYQGTGKVHPFRRSPPARIGHDVWIGTRAIIMRGLTIGTGAVIGAGAVVTHDVAPYEIVGGVPARLIRKRFKPKICAALLQSEWWTLDPVELEAFDLRRPWRAAREILDYKRGKAGAP